VKGTALTCISDNLLHPCLHLRADWGKQHFLRDSGNEVMVNSGLSWSTTNPNFWSGETIPKLPHYWHDTVVWVTTNLLKSSISWDVKQCSPLKVNWHFTGTCHLHLQGRKTRQTRNQHEAGSKQSNDMMCIPLDYFILCLLSPTGTTAVYLLPASCWFLVWLILLPWRWRWHIPPKRWLHGVISQKTEPFIATAVGTSSSANLLFIISFSLLHYWERISEITIQCLLIFTISLEHWTLHLTLGSWSTSSNNLWWILLSNANELNNFTEDSSVFQVWSSYSLNTVLLMSVIFRKPYRLGMKYKSHETVCQAIWSVMIVKLPFQIS
jgi:hypothetical protein